MRCVWMDTHFHAIVGCWVLVWTCLGRMVVSCICFTWKPSKKSLQSKEPHGHESWHQSVDKKYGMKKQMKKWIIVCAIRIGFGKIVRFVVRDVVTYSNMGNNDGISRKTKKMNWGLLDNFGEWRWSRWTEHDTYICSVRSCSVWRRSLVITFRFMDIGYCKLNVYK